MTSTYQEIKPSSTLAPFIECFWTRVEPSDLEKSASRVLPDGCLDILFEFNGSQNTTTHIIGTMTTPLIVTPESGKKYFGVRFNPGQIRRFANVNAWELTDSSVELESFWGTAVRELGEKITESRSICERVSILEKALIGRLDLHNDSDPYIDAAIKRAFLDAEVANVEQLVKYTGVSRQYLARRFKEYVGISPKMFCRVLRFRRLIAELSRGTKPQWGAIATELGYYDQAHLINDFREFSGLSPEKYTNEP